MNVSKQLGLASIVVLACIGNACAEEAKAASPQSMAASTEQANLINRLIAYGDARHDPILLLAAAKMQRSLSESSAPSSTESTKTEDVLQRAKKNSSGSKEIAALAEDIKASKTKDYNSYPYSGNYNSFHEQLRRAY